MSIRSRTGWQPTMPATTSRNGTTSTASVLQTDFAISRKTTHSSHARWAELYFSRNRFTIERDQTQSLYFLNSDVQRAVIDQERKDNSIQNYVKDSSLP